MYWPGMLNILTGLRVIISENFMYRLKHQEVGFTLIELLVVIAIIGLLATVVIASVSGMSTKTTETKHLAEIKEVQKALELYYSDYGHYPNLGTTYVLFSNSSFRNILKPYMKVLPENRANYGIPYDTYYSTTINDPECHPDSGGYIIHAALKDKKFSPYYYKTVTDGKSGQKWYFHCFHSI